jgi:hypothetical protein
MVGPDKLIAKQMVIMAIMVIGMMVVFIILPMMKQLFDFEA